MLSSRLASTDPFADLPLALDDLQHEDDAVGCSCLREPFDRWLPYAWVTAKWLWGLVVSLFFGAVVVGIVEEEDILWKSSLAVAGLLFSLAVVASLFAYRFWTRGARDEQSQSGGQRVVAAVATV